MTEMLSFQFVQHALVAGLMIAIIFGFVSFFVVMQRLSFLTVGVAHSAFGGVALGIFLGLSPYLTSVVFCLGVAFLIRYKSGNTSADYDAITGILFAATMALGIILLSLQKSYTFDVVGYLFGSILGISRLDLILIAVVCILVGLFFVLWFRDLLFMTFDPEVARSSGIPVERLETGVIVAVTLLVVVSIKIVGIILVTAFMILPASFSTKRCGTYQCAIAAAVAFSVCLFLCGFLIAYQLDLPSGAGIVLVGTLVYLVYPARRD